MSGGGARLRPSAQLSPRTRALLAIIFLGLLALSVQLYGQRAERAVVELRGPTMGTTWSVTLAGDLSDAAEQTALRGVRSALDRVNRLMSTWDRESELSRFNRHASDAPFPVAPETLRVVEIAQAVAERSGGAYDVTVGPLVAAWGFGSAAAEGVAPSGAAIEALRARIGYRLLRLLPEAGALQKLNDGLEVDLSSVAKGFAVDAVADTLVSLGHENFLVEIGGELRARGAHPEGRPWRVAIEDPAGGEAAGAPLRAIHRVVELRDIAMATSGDYRNYRESAGRRISHTIDPRTGRPIAHRLASVTVLHEEAAWADAWATALDVLGLEAGLELAEREGLAAYFIVHAGAGAGGFEVRASDAFEEWVGEASPKIGRDAAR